MRACSLAQLFLTLQPTRILCTGDLPGKSSGVGCHFLLQGIDLSNPGIKPASPSSVGIFLTTEPPGVNHFTLSPNTSMNFCFPTPLTTNGIYRCFTFCPNSLARPDYLTLVLICIASILSDIIHLSYIYILLRPIYSPFMNSSQATLTSSYFEVPGNTTRALLFCKVLRTADI